MKSKSVLPKRRRAHPEQDLQRAICKYLGWRLPKEAFFFAIPNGGWRTKAEAAILKATGVRAGVPDLCILYDGTAHFVELKAGNGKLSAAQKKVAEQIDGAYSEFAVWRSLDDAAKWLLEWRMLS